MESANRPRLTRTISYADVSDKVVTPKKAETNKPNPFEKKSEIPKKAILIPKQGVNVKELTALTHDTLYALKIKDDGSIHNVGMNSLETFHEAIARETKTKDTLLVAAKLLGDKKLKKEEKPFEASATKVVQFYNKNLDKSEKKELKLALNQAASLIESKIDTHLKINEVAKPFSRENRLNEVKKTFQDKNLVDNRDGVDVHRYIDGGQVSIVVENQERITGEAGRIGDLNKTDKESVKLFAKRIEDTMRSFEPLATLNSDNDAKAKLNDDINKLNDSILRDADTADAASSIEQTLAAWNKGTPEQKNMAKLLHGMNQQFTDGVTKPLFMMAGNTSPNTPGALLKIGEIESSVTDKLDKGIKKVNYDVRGNDITVTHTYTGKVKQDGVVKAEFIQKTTLTANAENLSDWKWSEELTIIRDKEDDSQLADKLVSLSNIVGYNAKLAFK